MTSLVLLDQALRLHDNPLLWYGARADGTAGEQRLVAVVCLDKSAFFSKQYGLARASLLRLQQQLQLISGTKQALARFNIGLVTLFGEPAAEISRLAMQLQASQIVAASPTGYREQQTLAKLSDRYQVTTIDVNSLLGTAALTPELSRLPDSFSAFRKQREPLLQVAPAVATYQPQPAQQWLTPEQSSVFYENFHQLAAFSQPSLPPGSDEQHALQRLDDYIWQQHAISHYKSSRNGLSGDYYASKFSAPLATGCLSARYCWQQILQYEQQIEANESTYWLKFELLWREFFRWQFRKYTNAWFSKHAIKGPLDFSPPTLTKARQEHFNNWCAGTTGVPFIDANMRLLNSTGLMSNRGRQNVASFLIHDLGVDWRLGAAYFEQRLLDYDVASNWGNWAYIAGSGNSGERQFNVIKQALSYDPEGDFVRAMLPELTAKGSLIHQPAAEVKVPEHWRNWLAKLTEKKL
ncbi:deoxyribodipyrimidine photo-lyase (single-stranded DNA-specific) [Arsukibacterium tuosuense]|uniref:Cryptochrome DASH n=1 Tax=Arsukibacterium tuosuense TaxID=1323745 RepID=A0A285J529_9GAMM|nr:DASH family cryptochrome [Arsukibacterium tuosuense]SNY54466.1 deoxyribodipyrimidine photo-lyase (single-stranded DNA-specific) [Arsukibacterium tuosuense]